MSKLNDFKVELLEKLLLKFCGEDGKKLVKHNHLMRDVVDKLGVIICDNDVVHKLEKCTDDELNCINSRLTMIINTLKDKEVK